ncbi:hypothetical protein CO657_13930 [Rhizobium acidisoli]|uniref:Uncharacterized protein n=1 Tax=Rhizobium acidisoli TaxID=1538158 RepID=A0AAE5WQ68_9HYPH|nr:MULTISPECIES: hypothetical protein [Rhizobium]QAS79099.1 hypothetical protein CO657_13930 [Rhizobium acidisoli]
MSKIWAKKEGHRKTRALVIVKVKNLQRGTANAVVLGEKPQDASAEIDMVLPWAGFNAFLCMPAMRRTIFLRRSILRARKAKKEGHWKTRALISVKVKNLQRGTANAVELGGKATMCISYVRYGGLMGKRQPLFVHASHAFNA